VAVRRLTLVRHGHSTANATDTANGDPSVPIGLDELGRAQADAVGAQLAGVAFDLAVNTAFARTAETLERILLLNRRGPVRRVVYPELGDLALGRFEGRPLQEYRTWRRHHGPVARPEPGGESRLDGLRRLRAGYARLMGEPAAEVLAVLHDVPIRFLLNGARGADPLAGPVRWVPNAAVNHLWAGEVGRALEAFDRRLAEG
jgi:broad specificity phosphatase PhoE